MLPQSDISAKPMFLEPERTVQAFRLAQGDYAAEFGPGHGYFTIAMARAVGKDGKVFAIDIQKETLEVIRAKAKADNLVNIELVWSDLERPNGSTLKDASVDAVVIANCLFQVTGKEHLIKEAHRILKQDGRLILVEWETAPDSKIGPPQEFRLPKQYVINLVLQQPFTLEREFDADAHHYGLLFLKK